MSSSGPNLFLSFDYMSKVNSDDESSINHGPPGPIANKLGVKSCIETCSTCATGGCNQCKLCPLHYDSKDKSSTISMFYQSPSVPQSKKSYFVIGGQAHELSGGLTVCFNGRDCIHGVWAPANSSKEGFHWHGSALVNRHLSTVV